MGPGPLPTTSTAVRGVPRRTGRGRPVVVMHVGQMRYHEAAARRDATRRVAPGGRVARSALWYRGDHLDRRPRCADGGQSRSSSNDPARDRFHRARRATTTVAEGLVVAHPLRGARARSPRVYGRTLCRSALATAPDVLLGLAPPLPGYPGTVEAVAGAVRAGARRPTPPAVSGTLVRADCGAVVVTRVVLITGASGGVGRGIAVACAGGRMGGVDRRPPRSARARPSPPRSTTPAVEAASWPATSSNAPSVAAAIATIDGKSGVLDGVVHNATSGFSSSQRTARRGDRSASSRTTSPSPCAAPTCSPVDAYPALHGQRRARSW